MTKALELAKFGRESAPTGAVIGDSDTQTLSSKTFSDGPVFSSGTVNAVPYLNASKVFSTSATFVFDGTNLGVGVASPGYMLHVKGGALAATSADGTVTSTLNYNSIGTLTNTDFVLNTNSIERARISSSGLAVTGVLSATGTTTIGNGVGSGILAINGQAANSRAILGQTVGTNRWIMYLGNPTAETGSDAGSNFQLFAVSDAGSGIDSPILITRASGGSIALGGTSNRPVTTTGNVGIATTNPQSRLHIYNSSGSATARLHGYQTADGQVGVLNFSNINDITGGYVIGSISVNRTEYDNSGALIFSTANSASTPTERLRINSVGNSIFSGNVRLYNYVNSGSENNRLAWDNGVYNIGSIRMIVGAGQINRGEMGFYVNNGASEQLAMYINYGQYVGIGNNNPAYKLDVAGTVQVSGTGYSSATSATIFLNNTTASTGRNFALNSYNTGGFQIADQTASGATRLEITATGNTLFYGSVGLGTTIPNARLSINTTSFTAAANTAQVAIENTEAWSQGLAFYIWGAGIYNSGYASGYIGAPNTNSRIFISGGARAIDNIDGGGQWAKTLNATAASFLSVGNGDTIFYGNSGLTANTAYTPTVRMVLMASGNVGIGTTDPSGPLHILQGSGGPNTITMSTTFGNGNSYAVNPFIQGVSNGGFSIRDVTNGVDRIAIAYSTGNVGIGTSYPTFKLHVNGTSSFEDTIKQKRFSTHVFQDLNGGYYRGYGDGNSARYEIARIAIDWDDWNNVGQVIIELNQIYYSMGGYSKWAVNYGYVQNSKVTLLETAADWAGGTVTIGTPVQVSGDIYYLPVYVNVYGYHQFIARLTTSHTLSADNITPGQGQISLQKSPTITNAGAGPAGVPDYSETDYNHKITGRLATSYYAHNWLFGNNKFVEMRGGKRNGDGTYSLFTRGNSSAQSSGKVYVQAIYGTPASAGSWEYVISGDKNISLIVSNTSIYSGPTPSIYWSGDTLYASNSNSSTYYTVIVELHNIGQEWSASFGNFPGFIS